MHISPGISLSLLAGHSVQRESEDELCLARLSDARL